MHILNCEALYLSLRFHSCSFVLGKKKFFLEQENIPMSNEATLWGLVRQVNAAKRNKEALLRYVDEEEQLLSFLAVVGQKVENVVDQNEALEYVENLSLELSNQLSLKAEGVAKLQQFTTDSVTGDEDMLQWSAQKLSFESQHLRQRLLELLKDQSSLQKGLSVQEPPEASGVEEEHLDKEMLKDYLELQQRNDREARACSSCESLVGVPRF